MKKFNFALSGILMLLVSFFYVQTVSAADDVPLSKDPKGTGTLGPSRVSSLSQVEISTVTASISDTELNVNFGTSVGVATITILDQYGSVVYQTSVSTSANTSISIPVVGWNSENYTLKVSYGTTKLVGYFIL